MVTRNRFGAIRRQVIGELQVQFIDGPGSSTLKLASNGREVWAVWDSEPGISSEVRRVYPTLSQIYSTGISNVNKDDGFALAVDENGHLYIANVENPFRNQPGIFRISLDRLMVDGEKKNLKRSGMTVDFIDQIPDRSKISLTLDGDKIHLMVALSLVEGSGLFNYQSSVRYYSGTNHPNINQISFAPPLTIATNASSDPTKVIGAEIDMALDEPGSLPAVIAYDSINEVHWLGYFDFSDSTWKRQNLPQPGKGGPVGIAPAGGGRYHLLWSSLDSDNSARYSVWRANSVSPGSTITPLVLRSSAISPNPPDLGIASDPLGNPVYAHASRDQKGNKDYYLNSAWPLDITDENSNGFVFLQEAAGLSFGGGPSLGFRSIGSETFPTLTMTTLTGGSGFPNGLYTTTNFLYQVESTTDLDTWTSLPVIFVNAFEFNGRRTATYRTNLPLSTHPRQFMRVGVRRQGL